MSHTHEGTLAYYVFSGPDQPHVPDLPAATSGPGSYADQAAPRLDPLAVRIAAGDDDALREVMLAHYAGIVRFATSIVGDHDTADDIAQDVFTHVWKGRARLDPARSLRAYLFTSARNLSLNRLKASVSSRRLADTFAKEALTNQSSNVTSTPYDDLQASSAEARDTTRRAMLDKAIAELPERRRTALALRFDQGLSFAEAGLVLGISAKAAQQLVIRTIAELRKLLQV